MSIDEPRKCLSSGVKSPALWGDGAWLSENFPTARAIETETRSFVFRYRSAAHFVDVFRNLYGPVHKAFLALEPEGQAAMEAEIIDLIACYNTAQDGSMAVPSDYAEVVITK